MRVSPKTDKEIAEEGLWPVGTYDFEVIEAKDRTSKAGADMIELRVKLFDEHGRSKVVFDYLLDAMAGKLRHAAQAFDLLSEYENGQFLAVDCVGKTGQCKVSIQQDKNGMYPDRNGIADYVVSSKGLGRKPAQRTVVKAGGSDLDDEIPF